MDILINLLHDYTFQTVALGSALLGMISGVLGSFATLRKQSLLGDGVSHAALPGVAAAFLITGGKNTETLLSGALVSGLLATFLILTIVKHSRIKFDSALAVVMSVFFGLGMVLLTYVQKIPNANQAGLSRFIYGQASALLQRDVIIMAVCSVILMVTVLLLWKEFKLMSFDPKFAHTLGIPTGVLNALLSFLTVVAIIIGLQTVGVILMSAMLIAPAVAARQWCTKLYSMAALAAFFGALSGALGTAASSLVTELSTGPSVVVCVSIIAIISLLFAPKRGILSRILARQMTRIHLRMDRGHFDGPTA